MLDLFDSEKSTDEQDVVIGQFLEERSNAFKMTGSAAKDLVVYFIGHGGFVGRDADFYLAIRRTRMDNPRASSLPVMALADTLAERARHMRRIIILDCCFATAAFSAFQSGPAQVALEKTVDAFEVGQKVIGFPTKGTTLLCSSGHKSPSLILPDGSSTMFTKSFLDALVQGIPSSQEHLSLRAVKNKAAGLLSEMRNAPKPVVLSPDQSEGDVADIPFFPNSWIDKQRRQKLEEERYQADEAIMVEKEQWLKAEGDRLRKVEEEIRRQAREKAQALQKKEDSLREGKEIVKIEAAQSHTQLLQEPLLVELAQTYSQPQVHIPDKKIARRTIMVGIVGIAGATAVGGGIWLISASHPFNTNRVNANTITNQRPSSTVKVASFYTYRGHTDRVNAVIWSPDGKRIASGSSDKTVQVWNATDGSNASTYSDHTRATGIIAVAWSPDSKRIVSGSIDGIAQIWNATDGSNIYTYGGPNILLLTLAWSPDGKRIASGFADKTAQVWNPANGSSDTIWGSSATTYRGHTDEVNAVIWSPDGKRIASGSSDKTVQVWNATGGSNVYTYHGHTDRVNAVIWSPDGKHIASGSSDKTVQVWNATDGSNVYTYHGHTDEVNAVTWSPDGKRIASGSSDKTVQVWNATDGSNASTYRSQTDRVNAVTWSPDGKRIASGSSDKTVQVWQTL